MQCLEWCPEVFFDEFSNTWKNVGAACKRASKIVCAHRGCRAKGAALGCSVKECPHSFHYGCARALKHCKFDEQQWHVLCPDCRTDLPDDLSRNETFGSPLQKNDPVSPTSDTSALQLQVGTKVSLHEENSWHDAEIISVDRGNKGNSGGFSVRLNGREIHNVSISKLKVLKDPDPDVSSTNSLRISPAPEDGANDTVATETRTRSSRSKRRKRSSVRNRCVFCGASSIAGRVGSADAPLLTFRDGDKEISAHIECMEWTPEIYYDEEENCWQNVLPAVARASQLACSHRGCGLKGAALGCSVESCVHTFHFRCARDLEFCEFDDQRWQITCPNCIPRTKLPRSGRGVDRDSLFGESEDGDGSEFTEDEISDDQNSDEEDKLHEDDDGIVMDLPETVRPESDTLFTGALLESSASVFVFAQTFQSILGIRPFTFLKFRTDLLKPYEGSIVTDLFFSLLNILLAERDRHLIVDADKEPQWMAQLPYNSYEPLDERVHWPLPSRQAKTLTAARCRGLHKTARLREYRAKDGENASDIAKTMNINLDAILTINSRYRRLSAKSLLMRNTLLLLPATDQPDSAESEEIDADIAATALTGISPKVSPKAEASVTNTQKSPDAVVRCG